MDALKTGLIFLAAVVGELGGTYAIWRWRREGDTPWLILVGMLALFVYALVQTFQPEGEYGRLYAAYAGVFLIGAMVWGWRFDGFAPDRYDLIGGGIALVGVAVVLWGRRVFA